ncbi:hypothetical protein BJ944DRAFT_272726 [Cunninghamella echinulata]|nr:hypothetical protein BJ944DRAFT_272726 [Cunninghamella echinulata]
MNQLPNEIIHHIFSYLSPRYISTCSLVCKSWHSTSRDASFYKVIKVNSYQQLKKFIETATTTKINGTLLGRLVNTLLLQDIYNVAPFCLTLADIDQLHHACPMITWVDEIVCPQFKMTPAQPYWKYLTVISSWVKRYDDDWYWRLYQKGKTSLVSFELNVFDCLQHIHHEHILYFEKDQQPRKRERLSRPLFIGQASSSSSTDYTNSNNSNNGSVEIRGEMINCFGKVLKFSTTWESLKSLTLDFTSSSSSSYSSPSSSLFDYELDERTIDSIFQSCPVLKHLSLDYFFMNISDQYYDVSQYRITPFTSLKVLQFNHCIMHQVECFYYFIKKCPNVTTLILYLQCYIHLDEVKKGLFRKGIYDMITQYLTLKQLSARLEYTGDYYMCPVELEDGFFPDHELKEWLNAIQPPQLKVLDYPYDLSLTSMVENEKIDNQHSAYLNYLSSFTLESKKEPSFLLNHYFLRQNTVDHASFSITTLNISMTISPMSLFNIFEWLNAFPNLKRLCVSRVAISDAWNKSTYREHYQLKELVINDSKYYYVSGGMNHLYERCPLIKVLKLDNVNYINRSINDNGSSSLSSLIRMDASRLMLDKLNIQYIHLGSTQSPENRITNLIVYESESKKTFHYEKPTLIDSPLKILFNCQTVDRINFM